jgi:group I intron endonuclease
MYNGPVKSGIYCIKNTVNGKVYIGSTARMHRRPQEHFRRLRRGTHESPPLQAAFAEYGESAFEFAVLESVSPGGLIAAEQRLLDHHKAADPQFGYNSRLKADSNSGRTFSTEFRDKIRAANIGKKHSDATKAKIRASHVGVKMPPGAGKKSGDKRRGQARPDVAQWAPEKFAMFKPEQVSQIRADRASGLTYRKLADKYGCSVGTAHFAVNGTGAFYSAI